MGKIEIEYLKHRGFTEIESVCDYIMYEFKMPFGSPIIIFYYPDREVYHIDGGELEHPIYDLFGVDKFKLFKRSRTIKKILK